jgi:hypothetical protein
MPAHGSGRRPARGRAPAGIHDFTCRTKVGLQRFFTEYAANRPELIAASFIMSVPVVALFLVL